MTSRKSPVKARSEARDKASDQKQKSDSLITRFARCYYEYESTVCQAEIEAAKKRAEAGARFSEVVQQGQRAAFKPAQEAYFEYLKVYQRIRLSPEEADIADIYRAQNNYLEAYQLCQESARKLIDEANVMYSSDCKTILEQIGGEEKAALEQYIRNLKDTWMSADPGAFDARNLAATAQNMASVATGVLSRGRSACAP